MPGESQDKPLISVVMPVHNGAPFLAESIGSILYQTYAHIEFIIVDDGYTDGSRAIIRDFAAHDPGIRPLFLSHRGQSAALNSGIAVAQGRFIAHMEQDDIALPQRLAAQLAWMRGNAVDICGGYLKRFDDE